MKKKCILVLAPHTDDGELGCGGSLARFAEEGSKIFYVAFSSCKESLTEEYDRDILEIELREATAVLGLEIDNVTCLNFPVRRFGDYRQEILEELVRFNRDLSPDLVLMPSLHDTHQDHLVIAAEGMRAFKRTCLLGYEAPWNNFTFNTQTFVRLEQRHVEKKVAAMAEYRSQSFRQYAKANAIYGLAGARGVQIGIEYAEVFETIRLIL